MPRGKQGRPARQYILEVGVLMSELRVSQSGRPGRPWAKWSLMALDVSLHFLGTQSHGNSMPGGQDICLSMSAYRSLSTYHKTQEDAHWLSEYTVPYPTL